MIGQPIADLEKVTEVPSGSLYIANMGDGSGTKAVTQETLTKEVGKGLKVGNLAELQTENKNNLVAAINEAAQSGGGGAAVDILDTKEEIEANTESGKAAGAQAVKEMLSEINDNLGYDTKLIDGVPHWSPRGADTWSPFSNTLLTAPENYIINYTNGHGTGDTLTPSFSGFEIGKRYFFIALCSSVLINCEWSSTMSGNIHFGVFTANNSSLQLFRSSGYAALYAKVFQI